MALSNATLKFVIFLKIAVMLISLSGNSLVIVCIIVNKRLRNHSNNLVCSLAVTNILGTLWSMGDQVFKDVLLLQGRHGMAPIYCKLRLAFVGYTFMVRTHHLLLIAVDRYLAIIHPFKYPKFISSYKFIYLLIACWCPAVLISFVPLYTLIYTTPEMRKLINEGKACNFVYNEYWHLMDLVTFWIPCMLMVFIYLRIFLKAKKLVDLMRRTGFSQKNTKSMISLGLILGTFLIGWMPLYIYDIYYAYHKKVTETSITIIYSLYWLGLVTYCSDPFIYGFQNKGFRYEAIYILRLLFSCKNVRKSDERDEIHSLWIQERAVRQQRDSANEI